MLGLGVDMDKQMIILVIHVGNILLITYLFSFHHAWKHMCPWHGVGQPSL